MMAAWIALSDYGREVRAAAKHSCTTKACRLRPMIVRSIATGMLVIVAEQGMAADDGRGASLAAICASCHRLDGRDQGIPSIVGLNQKQFVDLMAAFKSGERPSQIMRAIALSLRDEEVATLAGYLAAQPRGSKQ